MFRFDGKRTRLLALCGALGPWRSACHTRTFWAVVLYVGAGVDDAPAVRVSVHQPIGVAVRVA